MQELTFQRSLDIALGFPGGGCGTLVIVLFAFADTDLELDEAVVVVDFEGDEGQAAFLGLADEILKLTFFEEELAGALGIVVLGRVAGLIGSDLRANEVCFIIKNLYIRTLDARLAGPDCFDFMAGQQHPRFQGF